MPSHPNNPTLPDDWTECRLGNVLSLKKEKHKPVGKARLFYVGLEHIEKNTGRLLEEAGEEEINTVKNSFDTSDILYGKLRPYLNKTHLAIRRGVCSTDILVFTPSSEIDPKYALSYMLSREFVNEMSKHTSGVNLPRVSTKFVQSHPIPLAPLPEQRAIVAKIEQLFSELDNGIENLKTARAKLDIYRQAVLKKAFEGELTRDWRARQTNLPTADELLEQIKAERQKHYDIQLAEWKAAVKAREANGKPGKKPSKPGKLKDLTVFAAGELDTLPTLPKEWAFSRLSGIAEIGSGMSVSKSRKLVDPIEVPYLRVANVQRGHLLLTEIKAMPIEKTSVGDFELKKWDVLFNEGGDRDKLGRGWIWENQVTPCITQNHVFRASLHCSGEDQAKFISHWGNTFGRDYFERTGKQTTNLASINKAVLSMFPVPVVSAEEQHQIVQEIESRLSVCDKLAETIDTSLKQAESLRQSILKKAFTGQLLTPAERAACRQAPDYRPATELVGRKRSFESDLRN